MTPPPNAGQLGLVGCLACGLVCKPAANELSCPRCAAPLHRRKPHSVSRSLALLIAALIFTFRPMSCR